MVRTKRVVRPEVKCTRVRRAVFEAHTVWWQFVYMCAECGPHVYLFNPRSVPNHTTRATLMEHVRSWPYALFHCILAYREDILDKRFYGAWCAQPLGAVARIAFTEIIQ
jgi:hypothetical protein